jgi:hypothetical protein
LTAVAGTNRLDFLGQGTSDSFGSQITNIVLVAGCGEVCENPWAIPAGTNSLTPIFQSGINPISTLSGKLLIPTGQYYCTDAVGLPSAPGA